MSIRVDLSDSSMDLVMDLVRKLDTTPSNVIDKLLQDPDLFLEAWSRLNERVEKTNIRRKDTNKYSVR